MYTWICGSTIFLGAFLLFQIQPILAKRILPWFGGSAAVWTTCVLFFQSMLFAGYAYAHWLRSRRVHMAMLLASLFCLPVLPSAIWKPDASSDPIVHILKLLLVCVGLPFLLLSSTSPLIQSWYAQKTNGQLPYRYFALSNLASLLALLGYPLFVERWLTLPQQGAVWSALYALYVGSCIAVAWMSSDRKATRIRGKISPAWLALSAVASALSLSITNHLSQNVAPIPFLWVVPLAAYLLTFVVAFDSDRWYQRWYSLPLHAASLGGMAYLVLKQTPQTDIRLVIALLTAGLFVCCLYCHGELARRKPEPEQLTQFYLTIAAGGALGGLLVAVGAPLFLKGNFEFPIALALCAFVTLMVEYRKSVFGDLAWVSVAVGTLVIAMMIVRAGTGTALLAKRNFYGALRIVDVGESRLMVHGTISHGSQYLDAARRRTPTTYYAQGSGVQKAFEAAPRRVGIIGLGAGTLAAYGKPGDVFRFYELNPQVADLARSHFTFLSDSPARHDIILGDGRLSLEREQPQNFDLLVVDAFSGDSIPVHLLSKESFESYLRHVAPNGRIAIHVSNTALHISPVVRTVAASLGLTSRYIVNAADPSRNISESEWVLVARDGLEHHPIQGDIWTDDFSPMISILK